jgi:toxin ParE1/3/4
VRVIWTPEAQEDRAEIWDYIATDSPRAAARMDELFSDSVARIADYPKLGTPGKIAGTRELVPHESYRLVYEIEAETIWILAIVHTARLWPPIRPDAPH